VKKTDIKNRKTSIAEKILPSTNFSWKRFRYLRSFDDRKLPRSPRWRWYCNPAARHIITSSLRHYQTVSVGYKFGLANPSHRRLPRVDVT